MRHERVTGRSWTGRAGGPAYGALCALALAACAAEPAQRVVCPLPTTPAPPPPAPLPPEEAPTLRLPGDVHPLAESIELHVDPQQPRFSGVVEIDVQLDRPRDAVWLDGRALSVSEATLTPEGGAPIHADWQEQKDTGIAALRLATRAPAGRARVRVAFEADYGVGQKGLYVTSEAGQRYVFSQFEAIAARLAFPCFDEPSFKIPFTTTLVVPADMQAVANTREVSRSVEGPAVRVRFAPTLPLPSYLVAFAVGPFDVVAAPDVPPNATRARPLPLRGIAPRGRGKDMTYALAHTGELVATLEQYFGLEYPWDKLDILAVPGKGGAMENAGAITFGEKLLLFDVARAPVAQRRGYAYVMAHELAHQWTGDLVTMAWWDDTWLNEAFATWLGNKAAQQWDPSLHQDVAALRGVHAAMGSDALVSARAIRQPIASANDIENAFDGITYQKGGAVLGMFERFAGAEAWRKGLRDYLVKHRLGNGTADDFLDAENAATGADVRSAFHTFLDQPGEPLLHVVEHCQVRAPGDHAPGDLPRAVLEVEQSRFLPVGSAGHEAQVWQVPFCERSPSGAACQLLTQPKTEIALGGKACPVAVLPNVDAAGYYRFTLPPEGLARLRQELPSLSTREKMAYALSLRSGFSLGTTSMRDVLLGLAPLAADADPAVVEEPTSPLGTAREWLFATPLRARVERYGRDLYAPVARRLGWEPKKGEDEDTRALRGSVLSFLAMTARDGAVRAEARRRGRIYLGLEGAHGGAGDGALHPEVLDANVVGAALGVVGEEADRKTWDAMRALLAASVDETLRGRLAWALGLAQDPALAAAGRELVLDRVLRDSEILTPLWPQLDGVEKREAAWAWVKEHYAALLARLPQHHGGVQLVAAGRSFCDEEHARDVEAFFAKKVDGVEGGPRVLAQTLETVRLCAAKRGAQEAGVREFFARGR